jgi:hypothetical protein
MGGHNGFSHSFGRTVMITANDIRQRIRAHPFQPFRVYLTDGRHFDIPDPTWTLVGEPVIFLGVASEDDPRQRVPERTEMVDYALIDRVETLPAATATK